MQLVVQLQRRCNLLCMPQDSNDQANQPGLAPECTQPASRLQGALLTVKTSRRATQCCARSSSTSFITKRMREAYTCGGQVGGTGTGSGSG